MSRATPVEGLGPHTPNRDAAPRLLGSRLYDVRMLAHAARSVDQVHDLRVATRRLRAAIGLFGPAEAAPEVKRLGDALGKVRDLDVQLEWLEDALQRAPGEARPGVAALIAERRGLLPDPERALTLALARFTSRAPALAAALARVAPRGKLGGKRLMRRLDRGFEKLAVDRQRALRDGSPDEAHALRIRLKKLRYQGELLAPERIEPLVPLQKLLGELHDRDVQAPICQQAVRRASPGERAGALWLLAEVLANRARLSVALADALSLG